MSSYADERRAPRHSAAGQPWDPGGPDRAGGGGVPARIPVRPAGGRPAALAVATDPARGGVAAAVAGGRPEIPGGVAAGRFAAGGAYPRVGRRGAAAVARRGGGRGDALRHAVAGGRAGTGAGARRTDRGAAAVP